MWRHGRRVAAREGHKLARGMVMELAARGDEKAYRYAFAHCRRAGCEAALRVTWRGPSDWTIESPATEARCPWRVRKEEP